MKKIIASPHAPKAVGPYSQAVEAGGALYVSGQLPIDGATSKMDEGVEAQTHRSLTNLRHILEEGGYTLGDVVKQFYTIHHISGSNFHKPLSFIHLSLPIIRIKRSIHFINTECSSEYRSQPLHGIGFIPKNICNIRNLRIIPACIPRPGFPLCHRIIE